ncbi:MAG: NYN domain-containing protein [Thermoplasmata archaeon]
MAAQVSSAHADWTDRPRSVSLIDAQYLRAARDRVFGNASLDLLQFAERIVPRFHWRFRTYYFDAPPYKDRNNPTEDQIRKFDDKRAELKTIARLDRFSVREGYCQFTTKKAKPLGHPGPLESVGIIEQKMVDVLLATEMTRIAWSKEAQHITLVAGDSDYVAAVQAAKNAGALVRLYYFKEGDTSYGDRLFDEVDERFNLADILSAMRDQKPDHRRPTTLQS